MLGPAEYKRISIPALIMRSSKIPLILWCLIAAGPLYAETNDSAQADGNEQESTEGENNSISFARDVAPILLERCQACHGAKKAESSYRLDTFALLKQAGDYETDPIVPEDPDGSELVRLISTDDDDERMPKDSESLTAEQIQVIRSWIEQGAKFDGSDEAATLSEIIPRPPYPVPPESYPRPFPITAMAFHPQGSELFVAGYHELSVWNPTDGTLLRRINNIAQRTYAIRFSPDGSTLAIGGGTPGKSGEIRLLNPADGSELKLLGTTPGVVFDIAFRADGLKLAAGVADRTLRIYDVATGQEERVVEHHADWVLTVDWSPDGKQLATGSRDKTGKLVEVETGALLGTYGQTGQPVYRVVFHKDGKHVYSAGGDGKIHLWKTENAEKEAEITDLGGEVYDLVHSGEHLFSSSQDGTARQHKESDRQLVHSYAEHSDWVFSLAVHADTQRLATGCFDGQVRVWNTSDGSPVTTFTAAPGYQAP